MIDLTLLYEIITLVSLLFLWPVLVLFFIEKGLFKAGFRERLGYLDIVSNPDKKRIWFHCASVGEVIALRPILEDLSRLIPNSQFFVSTNTYTGRSVASNALKKESVIFFAPLDLIPCVRRAIGTIKPHVMIFVEGELWPCWVRQAKRMGVRLAIVNGRISPRSFRSYMLTRFLWSRVLSHFDSLSMISQLDARRIIAMGADPKKVMVNGNSKWDAAPDIKGEFLASFKTDMGLDKEGQFILVAGSVRKKEYLDILEAYRSSLREINGLVLILAPRHLDLVQEIVDKAKDMGLGLRRRTGHSPLMGTGLVILLDSMGELPQIYSLADLVFLGASLVPLGGQNPIEPASLGKPLLFGPHMEDFLDAARLMLERGAAMEVRSSQELSEKIVELLKDPEKRRTMGEKALMVAQELKGASRRHSQAIISLLQHPVPR